MTKDFRWIAPALLALALTAACAAPAAAPQLPASTAEPSQGAGNTGAAGGSPASAGTPVAAPAPPPIDVSVPGMSLKSTRGHVWAEPVIDGDEVAIVLAVATLGDHVHFEVTDGETVDGFIGYFCEGEFCVRADVCPLCGAERIESGGSVLVCRSCGVIFDLVTGESEEGTANFPSGTVPCTIDGDFIKMSLDDLVVAHARTVAGEATLFEEPVVLEAAEDDDSDRPACCTR